MANICLKRKNKKTTSLSSGVRSSCQRKPKSRPKWGEFLKCYFLDELLRPRMGVPAPRPLSPVPRPLLGLCPSQGLRDVDKKKGTRIAKLDMLLKMVVLSLLLLLLAVNTASLAKIAGFAAVGGSGYINLRNIMEELASRGHEVH